MANQKRYCPRCGAPIGLNDFYCIKCGYRFTGRRKKGSFFTIILLLIVAWIAIRMIMKQPIIPQGALDFVKSLINSTNKTK